MTAALWIVGTALAFLLLIYLLQDRLLRLSQVIVGFLQGIVQLRLMRGERHIWESATR